MEKKGSLGYFISFAGCLKLLRKEWQQDKLLFPSLPSALKYLKIKWPQLPDCLPEYLDFE